MGKNRIKIEQGITLIALVVTIIIILIISGVSISMFTGKNSIINRVSETQEKNSKGTVEEIAKLAYMGKLTENSGENISDETAMTAILTELNSNGYEVCSTFEDTIFNGLKIQDNTGTDLTQDGEQINLYQGMTTETPITVSIDIEEKTTKNYVKINGKWYEISIKNGQFKMSEEGLENFDGKKTYKVVLTTPESGPSITINGNKQDFEKEIIIVDGTILGVIAGQTTGEFYFNVKIEDASYSKNIPIVIDNNPTYATNLSLSTENDVKKEIVRGETLQLVATKEPPTATDTIKWKVIEGDATISDTGLVTAKENAVENSIIKIGTTCERTDNTETTVAEKNISLTVKVIRYTITYNGNGKTNSVEMESDEVVKGENITLKTNTFEKSGYNFVEWNTESDGTGTSYSDGAKINNVQKNITLYAIWRKKGLIEGLTIGTAKNSDKYGYKVNEYNVTTDEFTSGIWRLYYQDENFTYIITDTCVGSYFPYDTDRDGNKYASGENVGWAGRNLNPSANKRGYFTKDNKAICLRGVAWLTDNDVWGEYANEDAVFAIGSPTMDLFKVSYTATRGSFELSWYDAHGDLIDLHATGWISKECKGIYCKNTGDVYWFASISSNTSKMYVMDSGAWEMPQYYCFKDSILNTTPYSVRPIVCFKTSVFEEKYTLTNE